jgi:hypothetical protein
LPVALIERITTTSEEVETMKFLIVGHSHIVALSQAAQQLGLKFASTSLVGVEGTADLRQRLTASLENLTEQNLSGDIGAFAKAHDVKSILIVGGNYHNVLGLLEHTQPFDFALPGSEDLPLSENAEVIPYDVIRDSMYHRLRDSFLTINYTLPLLGSETVHVESPPPIGDDDFIARNLDWYFKTSDEGLRPKIAPPALRYKLWRVSCELYARHCRAAGIPYIYTSVDLDHGMFLPQKYYATNATHANALYGRELVSAAMRYFERANVNGTEASSVSQPA